MLLMYVSPRITIDSMRPGRLRNEYQKGLILQLTLQWLGKLWKSSGSIQTMWLTHSRLGTPELSMVGLMSQLPETVLFPDTSGITL